ncbi:MAG: UbiX family flavin prenyltransferase [Candidatus Bathyarchaeia archaeon]
MKWVIGFSGASGAIYGVSLLKFLSDNTDVETHLIITKHAEKIVKWEVGLERKDLEKLANYAYDEEDLDAPPTSGSFQANGMVIVPCSMKTLSCIAYGIASNLLIRAADVALKEKRRLILVPRETPLTYSHLKAMGSAAHSGAIILPAMPAFYHKPETITELVNFIVGKILDLMGIEHQLYRRWGVVAQK